MQQYEENSMRSGSPSNANDSSFCSVRVNVSGPDSKKLLKGWCTRCCKPAIYKCKRCGDFYCSPECQKLDWRSHRYLCFPMPSLVYAESSESFGNAPKPRDDNGNNQKRDAPASEGSFELGSVHSKSSDQTGTSRKNLAQASPPSLPHPKYGSAKPMDDDGNNQKSETPASEGSFEIGSVHSKSSDQAGASNLAQASPPSLPYPKYGRGAIYVG